MALGATRANILQLILGRTLKLAAFGIVAGLIAAFFLARFLNSILFGITAHDTVTFISVPFCLIVIALLAGYLPPVAPPASIRYARCVTSSQALPTRCVTRPADRRESLP